MGNTTPLPPQPTMEEIIIEMKLAARRFTNESNKAEREEKASITKAKTALNKNNEECAKMFLTTAAMKHNECNISS